MCSKQAKASPNKLQSRPMPLLCIMPRLLLLLQLHRPSSSEDLAVTRSQCLVRLKAYPSKFLCSPFPFPSHHPPTGLRPSSPPLSLPASAHAIQQPISSKLEPAVQADSTSDAKLTSESPSATVSSKSGPRVMRHYNSHLRPVSASGRGREEPSGAKTGYKTLNSSFPEALSCIFSAKREAARSAICFGVFVDPERAHGKPMANA